MDNLEKAGKKDTSKLQKKLITNKRGKRTTVWVKTGEDKPAFTITASNGKKYGAIKVKGKSLYIAIDSKGNRIMEGQNSSKRDFKDMVEHHIKGEKAEVKEAKRKSKVQSTGIEKIVQDTVKKMSDLKKVSDKKLRQGLIEQQLGDITSHKDAKDYIEQNKINSMQELVEHLDGMLMSKKKGRLSSDDIFAEKVKHYRDIFDKAPTTPKAPKKTDKGNYADMMEAMKSSGRTPVDKWMKLKGAPNTMIILNGKGESLNMINFNPNNKAMAVVVKITKNNKVSKHRLGE